VRDGGGGGKTKIAQRPRCACVLGELVNTPRTGVSQEQAFTHHIDAGHATAVNLERMLYLTGCCVVGVVCVKSDSALASRVSCQHCDESIDLVLVSLNIKTIQPYDSILA